MRNLFIGQYYIMIKLTREFYIPNLAQKIETMAGIEVFEYTNETLNKQAAICFVGKTIKPTWHHHFENVDSMKNKIQKTVQKYIADKKAKSERMKNKNQSKTEAAKLVNIGDIFVESSHYEFTVIDFWQVVAKQGVRLELMQISKRLEETGSRGRNEEYMPNIDDLISGKTMKISISSKHNDTIYLTSRSWYSVTSWSGKPVYQTSAYWR